MTVDNPADNTNDTRARNARLARLLAQALDSRAAGHGAGSACPDAEVIAAYADHGLDGKEAARWEGHFADCQRCQKIIAVLAVSSEDLEQAEIQKLGNLVAASAAREASRQSVVKISPRPAVRRWLLPAFGVAAAVILWLALRPALTRQSASQGIALNAPSSQGAAPPAAASSANPAGTQMAQANVPPPPSATASQLRQRDEEVARVNPPADALKESARQEALQSRAQAPAAPEANLGAASAGASETAAKDLEQTSQQADQKSQTTTASSGAVTAAAPAPLSPSGAQFARAPRAAAPNANTVRALAATPSALVSFASPDRTSLWRAGSGGLIERSTDQGLSWETQASGVTGDLLAGAAPSKTVAWAVGRGGIILRTEDGDRWQQITPPTVAQKDGQNGAPPDWIAVQASDALRATIVSRDMHRFSTSDGGRTWAPQP